MFSVFKDVSFVNIDQHFYISITVALSILKALQEFNIKKLMIKWPNDILSENKKIAGILIENVIKQNQLQGSIIGVGLNVNQTEFENLPNASSLKLLSGEHFNLDELLHVILKHLKMNFEILKSGNFQALKADYEELLFRKNKPSTFKNAEGHLFSGFIIGVSNSGCLKVQLEDQIIKEFDLKSISLLY